MGIVIRQSIKSSIFSYLGVLIGYLNILWLFPKILDPDQIGLVRTIQHVAMILVPFAQIGISQSIIKFFPQFSKIDNGKRELFSFFIFSTLFSVFIVLLIFNLFRNEILFVFKDKAAQFIDFFNLSLIILFILSVHGVLEAFCRSLLKTVVPNFLRNVFLRLMTLAIIVLYFLGIFTFETLLLLIVIINGFNLVALIGYLIFLREFKFVFYFRLFDKVTLKKIINYCLFSLLGASGSIMILNIDSIMVTSLLGLSANGIYTTAFFIGVIIEIPRRAISEITSPLIASGFQNNDFESIKTIYKKTSLNQLIIGLLLYVGIISNLDNIFYLIPKSEIFEAGKYVVVFIGLGKLISMAAGTTGEIIVLSKYYRYNIIFLVIVAFVTFYTNYLLIPIYGITGAAIGSAISLAFFNLIKFLFILWRIKIQPFTFNTLKTIGIGILAFVISYLIPQNSSEIIDILLRSFVIFVVYSLLVLFLKVSPDVNQLYSKILKLIANKS